MRALAATKGPNAATNPGSFVKTPAAWIQRSCSACAAKHDDEPLRLQRRMHLDGQAGPMRSEPSALGSGTDADAAPQHHDSRGAPPALLNGVRARDGSSLPGTLKGAMERGFGFDFSKVRVHTDEQADRAARSLGAEAFTLGTDVVFRAGAWNPHSYQGQHLLAHELAHVVQQDGQTGVVDTALTVEVGDAHDPLEAQADSAADAVMHGRAASVTDLRPGRVQRRIQRAVSTVCNPPSMWLMLAGNPAAVPLAVAFGAIAELFISSNVLSVTGVSSSNAYQDNPLAGPIDPAYVSFIIAKNPSLAWWQQLAIAASVIARPDIMLHQSPIFEFEEIKPNSVAGRAAGRGKVSVIDAFLSGFSLPYGPGSTYTPPAPIVLGSTTVGGVPLTVSFEISRDRNGLLVYDICIETDWALVAALAFLAAAAAILIILSDGALGPIIIPALAANDPPPPEGGGATQLAARAAEAPAEGAAPA